MLHAKGAFAIGSLTFSCLLGLENEATAVAPSEFDYASAVASRGSLVHGRNVPDEQLAISRD